MFIYFEGTTSAGNSTSTTKAPPPCPTGKFDAASFFGGILLGLGLCIVSNLIYKWYQSRHSPGAPYQQFWRDRIGYGKQEKTARKTSSPKAGVFPFKVKFKHEKYYFKYEHEHHRPNRVGLVVGIADNKYREIIFPNIYWLLSKFIFYY